MSDLPDSAEPISASEKEFVLLLISLYRDLPELWKIKSKDYQNKTKKNLAYEKMLRVLRKSKPDYDVDKLKKKINVLRTNFNREYNKINKGKKCGAFTEDNLVPTLWYFNYFLFIKDRIEIAKTEASEQPLPNQPVPAKKKKSTPNDNTAKLVDFATYFQFKKPESETDILAKAWALKLSRIAPDQRRFAEKIINDTLFEAEMGTLTRNFLT